jgi:hypothetical protein
VIQNIVQLKVTKMEKAYHHKLQAHDKAWQKYKEEVQARELALLETG